jgi:hypothetical protein
MRAGCLCTQKQICPRALVPATDLFCRVEVGGVGGNKKGGVDGGRGGKRRPLSVEVVEEEKD